MNTSATRTVKALVSWAASLWIWYVFLLSLPYKFTGHPDTQHIFGTIGRWMQGIVGDTVGGLFINYGAYAVGSFELLTSLVLLLPAALWAATKVRLCDCAGARAKWHGIGGAMAAVVMAGAVFFHLATPLGVEVLHQGESDGGSLFYSAVSILILGIVLFVINTRGAR